jgi:hypothetical protein
LRKGRRTQRRVAQSTGQEAPGVNVAISPLEGPLGVQPASSNGSGTGRRGGAFARVVRRIGESVLQRSESGDEIVLSDAARALADALEAQDREGGSHGN